MEKEILKKINSKPQIGIKRKLSTETVFQTDLFGIVKVVVAVVEVVVEVEVGVGVIVVMVEYLVSFDMVVAFFDDLYLSLSTACLIVVIAMMMMILSC